MRAIFSTMAILLLGAIGCGTANADTPVTLFKSFAGTVNFVGTQKTMLTKKSDKGNCPVAAAGTELSASLTGIPVNATIVSAHLYWAGSSGTVDTKVIMDGAEVTAARSYSSSTIGSNFNYFGGAADVTAQVGVKRNATYKFSGLTMNNGAPYCAADGVLGGFALLVVYSDAAEPNRVLNLYEGFQFIRYNGVTLNVSNFRTPGGATGKIGHLTWDGDQTSGMGEDLFFNNVQMTDTLNLKENQFNSASNINNDPFSYGIDFDAYTVGATALAAGQTSATLRYESGQDMVLLNAEIVALPSVPLADLGIAMTRNSALVLAQNATYTLKVGNGGPQQEAGPVVVTATLPAGLSYVAATGAGWTCGAADKVVTCSRASNMAAGAVVQAITLTVRVDASGTLTNTASVTGQMFDNNTANNVATDTAEVSTQAAYVFTDAACVHGKAFGSGEQTCKQLNGTPTIAGTATPTFVTALADGVPTRLSATADTAVAMRFALICVNPETSAGVRASYANIALPLCTANGVVPAEWSSSVDMLFAKDAPSAATNASFLYADVGKVRLFLRDDADRIFGAVPFVVKPSKLAIVAVTRTADGFVNPETKNASGNGFAKAGETFTVTAAAYTSGDKVAPNFGSEGAILTLAWQRGGELAVQKAMLALPDLAGSFSSVVGGVFTGTDFSFGEAGVLALTPKLANNDYLGAGMPTSIITTTVGRFYPDHFDTVTSANMSCLPHMLCPETGSGATYSSQAFSVKVSAMNAANGALRNFNGALARAITLTAYNEAGGATQPSAGVLSANVIAQAAILPDVPIGAAPIGAAPVYTLPKPFTNTTPRRPDGWSMPTPIFLRASAEENIAGGTVVISSLRGGASVEGGVTVVSGRLALENPHGSELLKMPVRAQAQYWSAASRWETSAKDNVSPMQNTGIAFSNCLKYLAVINPDNPAYDQKPGPCDAGLLGVTAAPSPTLKNGMTTFWLRAPGAGKHGSAEFQMNNPPWLPSTISRAVFGVYKSPIIYRRELY